MGWIDRSWDAHLAFPANFFAGIEIALSLFGDIERSLISMIITSHMKAYRSVITVVWVDI